MLLGFNMVNRMMQLMLNRALNEGLFVTIDF